MQSVPFCRVMLFSFPFRGGSAVKTPARPSSVAMTPSNSFPYSAAGHAWVGNGAFSPIQSAVRQPPHPPASSRRGPLGIFGSGSKRRGDQQQSDPKLDALRLQLTRMTHAVQALKQRFVQFATVAEQMGSVAKNVTADAFNVFNALEMEAPQTMESFMRLQETLAAHIVNVFKKEFDANLSEVVKSWLAECDAVEREVGWELLW